MRIIVLLALLASSGWAQSLDATYAERRAGEPVVLTIKITDLCSAINIYRKTGVTTAATLVSTLPTQLGVWDYEWTYRMPSGSTAEYRFFAVPKRSTELLEESNGVRIKRIK